MVSLTLRIRTFSVANVVTFVVYGALGSAFFLVTIALNRAWDIPPSLPGWQESR